MRKQSGNFLVQALLALTLIFAFIPFIATQLAARNVDAQMYSSTRQINNASTAARIFIRENARLISYGQTVVAGDDFADLLEPYGLPLGFVPHTPLGQDIVLVINKTPTDVSAYLDVTGGDLSELKLAELARRIGFYATRVDDGVRVGIVLTDDYSDIVRRNEPDLDNSGFLTNIDMGDFSFRNAGNVFASSGEFNTAQFTTLSIVGTESGRKAQNDIKNITANKTVFQSRTGEAALALSRGTLLLGSLDARTVSKFGDMGNFTANSAAVYDFAMTAGRTAFTGPAKWNVHGNVASNKMNFSVERLDIDSYLNVTRGQDVFIDADTLEYSTKSGIEAGTVYASNITVRDQTSQGLSGGASGATILDIRPAGVSLLPDVLVDSINNDNFKILKNPDTDNGDTITCKDIIIDFGGVYNSKSLAQNLICQYVFWQRLEHRIKIKQCLMAGGSDCI
ncbi:MAG: hypothetical protein E7009_04190 [Alphaproteobacteria bacterium]|nr:hypothetical protein [Alphaproteobacteria bacterium]